jgi:hypothetical protein
MLDGVLLVNKLIYVNELYLCVDMVLCWMVLVLEDFICMQIDDLMLFGLIGNIYMQIDLNCMEIKNN